jgi:predicted metal-binding membrane protein
MPDVDDSNPYASPGQAANRPARGERPANPWRWSTQCLLGLFLGATGAALQEEAWNEPVHWGNIVPFFGVLPVYFAVYAAMQGMRSVALAIVLVMVPYVISFNALTYVMHKKVDEDYVVTPLVLMGGYLLVFVGGGLLLRLARRLTRRRKDG